MTFWSTTVRATHLVTNAAWFGGSLMGAVALNPAAHAAGDEQTANRVTSAGWKRWGPVQGSAIAAHLASGLAIVADNRRRAFGHRRTRGDVVAKTVLTALAVGSSAAAYQQGSRLGAARSAGDDRTARTLHDRMRALQWVTPALTGALLVLDADLGEQQRGLAGLLDRPFGS
ncbi:hypothetical protein G9U51_12470 [Calidifontibacter sp. DB0510]|uniref:Uncharacterized protein n=1 Tax=Metallococcus carri TaxID=1656884 RepID=A0A967B0M2_9MICO|nr:hypothetical protein [Metallococcus carri]NHN56594.1 hypothetical protein [Metallococcus carri]